jgi:nitroreductase
MTNKSKIHPKNLEAQITKNYHILEKGLSMPEIKEKFGKEAATNLLIQCEKYVKFGYSLDNNQFLSAIKVLEKYLEYNWQFLDLKEHFNQIVNSLNLQMDHVDGGAKCLSKEDIYQSIKKDFKEFSANRYSIRNFSDEEVDEKILIDAIRIAQKTPSVCNRQSSKVYIVRKKDLIQKVLSYQNGNRGFGHLVNKLLIVTTDIRYFIGGSERNQPYIDGGMFAMSLLYGLHYYGLGACPLNWCTNYRKDKKFKKMFGINDCENIIMIIAIGHLKDKFKVAVSQRRNLEDIVAYID